MLYQVQEVLWVTAAARSILTIMSILGMRLNMVISNYRLGFHRSDSAARGGEGVGIESESRSEKLSEGE